MTGLLAFFANLILFTAGAIVSLLWIILIIAFAIEIYDMITGKNQEDKDQDV